MKFDIKTWLIIGLTVVIVLLILFQPSNPDEGKQPYLDSIKVLKSEKAIISSRIEANQKASIVRQKKDSLSLALSLKEIARLKVKASKAVEAIPVEVIRDNPEIMIAIVAKDSVITKQSQAIDSLQSSLAFHIQVKEDLMSDHYDAAKIDAQLQEMADMRIVKLEGDLKRERRKGKLARVLIPIVGVAALLLGSQL